MDISLASTIQNGTFVTEGNPLRVFVRSWYFWLIQLVPSWKRDLQLGRRKDGLVRYTYSAGMPFMPEYNGGRNMAQVYCRSMSGLVHFTDDIIFRENVHGLFRMFVYLSSDTEIVPARDTLQKVEAWSKGEIRANQVPIIVDEIAQGKEMITTDQVYQIASGDEFANSLLCNRRPEPV